jgi:NADH dehydrogenase FAD-containing subunit
MGNELAFVPTDPRTLAAKEHENVFVIGDATDVPTSKAGSVAHFEAELLVDNLLRAMRGDVMHGVADLLAGAPDPADRIHRQQHHDDHADRRLPFLVANRAHA